MSAPRTIAVITGTRAEYGLLCPVLRAIENDPALTLRLLVCGAHLSSTFGKTVERIEADGFSIAERIPTLVEGDSQQAATESTANAVAGFGASFTRNRPDLVLVTGDRPEMLAAGVAAMLAGLPLAHLHGGELTFGAVDDAIRHALTKLSHFHFVSTEDYADRVIQMGENPDHVFVTGAPGLDNINEVELMEKKALAAEIGMEIKPDLLLCTFHPVTLEADSTMDQLGELLAAIEESGSWVIFTYPNADPMGRQIIEAIQAFAAGHKKYRVAPDLGTAAYFSLMNCAGAMIGNSSSGIIEAASFELPVINIGSRQAGRVRAMNVIDVAPEKDAIAEGITTALSKGFKESISGLINPYGDGKAAGRIVAVLRDTNIGQDMLMKQFRDLPRAG